MQQTATDNWLFFPLRYCSLYRCATASRNSLTPDVGAYSLTSLPIEAESSAMLMMLGRGVPPGMSPTAQGRE